MRNNDAEALMQKLELTPERIQRRLEQLDLSEADREFLRIAWPSVEARLDDFARRLYARFENFPMLRSILAHESRVARLIDFQKRYLTQLFTDDIDHQYVVGRIAIGLVHHRIRVTPQWYIATYAHFLVDHVDVLLDEANCFEDGLNRVIILMKNIFFDAALVLDAYGLSEFTLARNRRQLFRDKQATRMVRMPESVGSKPLTETTASASAIPANPFSAGVVGASQRSAAPDNSRHITRINLSDDETRLRSAFIELSDQDVLNLHQLKEPFERIVPTILADFYDYIQNSPDFRQLVTAAQVERLMQQVNSYWQEFVTSNFDRRHAASRMRVGVIHEHIGISPQSYLAGLSRQVSGFLWAFPASLPNRREVIKSFLRGLIFDVTFIIDAYMESRVETLLKTEGYASQLVTGLNASVVIVDSDRQILYANDRLVELTGIDPSILYMMHFEDAVQFDEAIEALNAVTSGKSNRLTFVRRWNHTTYRVSVMQLQESDESVADVFAVVLDDVSDLVRITSNIEEDEANYERLSNTVPAVLWEIELETQSIVMISSQSFEVTGYRAVYFLGRSNSWSEKVVPQDQGRFRQSLEQAKRRAASNPSAVTICEYQFQRANGTICWLRSHFSQAADSPQRVVAVTVDVSDAKLAEHRRISALTLLASGVSHNFNNALTAVLNNIELQKLELSNQQVGSVYLDRALQAGHRAANLIRHLQSYAGGRILKPSLVGLNALVQRTLLTIRSGLGKLDISASLAEDLWYVSVDENVMTAVLEQILFNAVQATDPQLGSIMLTTSNIQTEDQPIVDSQSPNGWVEISVTDSGVGMTSDVLAKATDPFFTTRSFGEGDGLGLSMVYGFVQQSGGHLQIESTPGSGTTVRILLPKSEPIEPQKVDSPQPLSILVVDDDIEVANATAQLLRQVGYTTFCETSSQAALRKMTEVEIHLLLTDLLLHDGVDGANLAIMAKKQHPGLTVVGMSGNTAQLSQSRSTGSFNFPVLAKPFSLQQLTDAVSAALAPRK